MGGIPEARPDGFMEAVPPQDSECVAPSTSGHIPETQLAGVVEAEPPQDSDCVALSVSITGSIPEAQLAGVAESVPPQDSDYVACSKENDAERFMSQKLRMQEELSQKALFCTRHVGVQANPSVEDAATS